MTKSPEVITDTHGRITSTAYFKAPVLSAPCWWWEMHRFDYYGIEKPCSCSDSSYGRTIYIKPDYDLHLFPPVPRNSEAFKEMLKRRTFDNITERGEEKLAGNKMMVYRCQSENGGVERVYELKYEVGTCKWYLYKM